MTSARSTGGVPCAFAAASWLQHELTLYFSLRALGAGAEPRLAAAPGLAQSVWRAPAGAASALGINVAKSERF